MALDAALKLADLATELGRSGTQVLRLSDDPAADLPYPAGIAEPLSAIPATLRAQQLALAMARARGVDPDRPPGLSTVTPTE